LQDDRKANVFFDKSAGPAKTVGRAGPGANVRFPFQRGRAAHQIKYYLLAVCLGGFSHGLDPKRSLLLLNSFER
jgi:hypothetical protein